VPAATTLHNRLLSNLTVTLEESETESTTAVPRNLKIWQPAVQSSTPSCTPHRL
jgi:hypothetical protein